MGDYTHDNLSVVGRHVPDPSGGPFQTMQEAQAAGHDTLNPVTGMYEIGVVVDGAFVPIISEKASLVFDRIDAARQQQQQKAAAEQAAASQADTGPQSTYSGTQPAQG